MSSSGSLNLRWSRLLIEELYRHGVTQFCIAPGSRSAPLTVAAAEHPHVTTSVHFDERGLAFFALGYGRATGKPAVVITTSGTAVANLFPAVVEASVDEIPLILLTADRPSELRQTSANQTIDQIHIFGNYLRWQFDLPCSDETISQKIILTTAAQGVSRALEPEAGPVQLNCMFREPLLPENIESNRDDLQSAHRIDGRPYTIKSTTRLVSSEESIESVQNILNDSRNGLLVIGSLGNKADRQAVAVIAKKLNWPVCAEVTSSLGFSTGETNISHYDLILGSETFGDKVRPDTVLHLGGRFVSKRLQKFLERSRPDHYIQINHLSERLDPGHLVSEQLRCHLSELRDVLGADQLSIEPSESLKRWQLANNEAARVISDLLDNKPELSEPVAARLLSRLLPDNSCLFVASSMPIRAMQMYGDSSKGKFTVVANRGASGIDGTVASATGYAAGADKPVTVFIGDLAMLHDLNSLALLRQIEQPVIIVVANNRGGGIFNQLPVAKLGDTLQKYFVTPHDYSFKDAASMFALAYRSVSRSDDFKSAYSKALSQSVSSIIELELSMDEDYRLHALIAEQVMTVVDALT